MQSSCPYACKASSGIKFKIKKNKKKRKIVKSP